MIPRPSSRRMSGRLLPFREGPGPRRCASGRGKLQFGSPHVPRRAEPAGAAAPFPRPSEAPRFRELIAPHIDAAYSLARYLARDAAAAEDIAQEALLKAFRNIDALRGDEVETLADGHRPQRLFRLAPARQRPHRHRTGGRGGHRRDAVAERVPRPRTHLIRQGDVAALRRAIETIPEPFREALVLRDLEELSYRDVAEVTGVPMGTVMSRLARARRMLGERMGVLEATA